MSQIVSCPGENNGARRGWAAGAVVLSLFALALLPVGHGQPVMVAAEGNGPVVVPTSFEFPDPEETKKNPELTERQKLVVKAVGRAVIHLQSTQNPQGTWARGVGIQHPVGYAAMPALALLEVGVPPADETIQRAARFVRTMGPRLDETYEISLAILFLNRLGDAGDEPLIRTLAFRLIAGQGFGGGWSYRCPILAPAEEQVLLNFLKQTPPNFGKTDMLVMHPSLRPLPRGLEHLVDPVMKKEAKTTRPIESPGVVLPDLIPKDSSKNPPSTYDPSKKPETEPKYDPNKKNQPLPTPEPGDVKPSGKAPGKLQPQPPPLIDGPAANEPGPKDPPKQVEQKQNLQDVLKQLKEKEAQKQQQEAQQPTPIALQQWPTVAPFVRQMMLGAKHLPWAQQQLPEDNSNTQFAILGLWAARKHDVPMALTLARLDQRFRASQLPDGAWSYHVPTGYVADPKKARHQMGTPSMTCVGLMGLGVSHGAFQEAALAQKKNPAPTEYLFDPAIQKGLGSLSKSVGPHIKFDGAKVNLYYFWSIERVMVMYHLPTLGGVDWHAWGTDVLLSRQTVNGSWAEGGYPGSSEPIDTSMAMLFLSRANLNRDLSESLRRYIVVVDPARATKP